MGQCLQRTKGRPVDDKDPRCDSEEDYSTTRMKTKRDSDEDYSATRMRTKRDSDED